MHPHPRPRFTIGRMMALIAVLAGLLAVPHLRSPTEIKVAACVVALFPIISLVNRAVEVLFGIPCPGCSRWTLRRLARNRSYARCSGCGGRFKRSWSGPWLDASGPEDGAIYRGKGGARPWAGYSSPEDPGETTTGFLLRNKRRRGRGRGFPPLSR